MRHILPDIDPFVRVAELGSFKKAAEQLGVTPTAVSKAIARLEETLNTSLFFRTTRQIDLTPEGKVFYEHCRNALLEFDNGIEALEETRNEASGEVQISTSFILGKHIATSLFKLNKRHPELKIILKQTDRYVDLARENIDIAIRIGEHGPSDLMVRKLASLRWITVASPCYISRNGWPQSPKELHNHICHTMENPSGSPVDWCFKLDGKMWYFRPQKGHRFDQGGMLLDVTVCGGGIVQIFDFMAAEYVQDGRLVNLFPDTQLEGPDIKAVCLPNRSSTPKIRATLNHLYRIFKDFNAPPAP